VATEFVLLIPIFFALVMGMAWAGTTFFRYVNVEYAAREGARYGATLPTGFPDDSDESGVPSVAWFEAVAGQAAAGSYGPATVCVSYSGLPGKDGADSPISVRYDRQPDGTSASSGGTCFTDGRGPDSRRVQVEVLGPVPLRGLGFYDGLLRGTATARFEAVYPAG
jgi:hypothetical protein